MAGGEKAKSSGEYGEQIVKNLKCKTDKFCYVCEAEDGIEYLGKKDKLVEVDIDAVTI